jgi:hypothetical protein
MAAMHTTITVNGVDGVRFLSSVAHTLRFRMPIPPALEWLLHSDDPSIDVQAADADQVEAFVEQLHADGLIPNVPPLLFSPRLGDEVLIARDALLEVLGSRRAPRTWVFVERGTRARLVARHDGLGRIVIGDGPHAREVAFAGDLTMTRARRAVAKLS